MRLDECEGVEESDALKVGELDYDQYDEIDVGDLNRIGFNDVNKDTILNIFSIDCYNFKSFANNVTMGEFSAGFSSIIGPNGNGKSNVIDSLLFVFGYRAAKIRSKNLSVLIHKSEQNPNCTSCHVKVNFIVKNKATQEIIERFSIKRSVNINNNSQYYTNDHPCSYKDVHKLLISHGVDLDHSRFLILQGEVEQISLMKPKKLPNDSSTGMLEYIEDVIGTSALVEPIEKYNERLNKMKEFEGGIVSELKRAAAEKDILQTKNDAAIEFLELENEIVELKYSILEKEKTEFTESLKKNEELSHKMQEKLKSQNEHLAKTTNEFKERDTQAKRRNEKSAKISEKISELQKKFNNCEIQDQKINKLISQALNDKNGLNVQKEKKQQVLNKQDTDPEIIKEKADELKKLIEYSENAARECQERMSAAFERFKTETVDLQKEKDAESKKLDALQQQINELSQKKASIQSEYNILQEDRHRMTNSQANLTQEIEKLKETANHIRNQIEELKLKKPRYDESLVQAQKDLSDCEQQFKKYNSILDEKKSRLNFLKQHLKSNERPNKILDFLYQQKSAGQVRGQIYGRLGDLGMISKKLDIAFSTASGAWDNIVVDNINTASDCIELLKLNKAGIATFVALDKMQKAPRQNQSREYRSGSMLFDLIAPVNEMFIDVLYFAVGSTHVAENDSEASQIAFGGKQGRKRVVTLTGMIVETSGAMSGGGHPVKGKVKLNDNSNATLDQSININPAEASQLQAEVDELIRNCSNANENIDRIQENIDQIEKSLEQLKNDSSDKEKQLEKLQMEITLKSKNLSSLESQINDFDSKNSDVMKKLKSQLKSHENAENKPKKALAEQENIFKALDAQLVAISDQIVEPIKKELESKQKMLEGQKQELVQYDIEFAKKKRQKLEKELKVLCDKIESVEKKIESHEKSKNENEESALETSNALERLKEELEKLNEQSISQPGNLNEDLKIINDLKMELKHTMAENLKLASECTMLNQKLANITTQFSELALNDTENVSKLSIADEIKLKILEKTLQESKDDLKKQYEKKSEAFQKLKVPDLRSIKDFRAKDAEYIEKVEKLNKHEAVKNKQRQLRDNLKDIRLSRFNSSFKLINQGLKSLYNAITMGGMAELELVDVLSPFEQGIQLTVMPPNKAWKNVSKLSGGEKTLSSLSLVFSLHTLRPSPFYVMDEIDAALDYKNVSIISEYIQQQALNGTQFIVISLREHMYINCQQYVTIYKVQNQSRSILVKNRSKPILNR